MTRKRVRWLWIPPVVILVLFLVFAGGLLAGQRLPFLLDPAAPPPATSAPDFSLMREAWDVIDRVYVDRSALKADSLTWGAIAGLVDGLGDTGHSAFLTPQEVQEEQSFIKGQYVGVGLEIRLKDNRVVIVAPLDDSPALRAGLRSAQEIQKVDGESVMGLTLPAVIDRIVGPQGTRVTLTVYDPATRESVDVTLTRQVIKIDNVSWAPLAGSRFADLRIAAFSGGVTEELKRDLGDIADQRFEGIVLDLRNNPGGELGEAIGVASQFLAEGDVLQEKDSAGNVRQDRVRPGGLAPRIPLAVLVNVGTASAAEIVAGALQDAGRGELVGEKTFGTGTVLQNFKLSDGSELLLAVTEWLTPKGRTIWHTGITPDLTVAGAADEAPLTPSDLRSAGSVGADIRSDPQLSAAMEILAKSTKTR